MRDSRRAEVDAVARADLTLPHVEPGQRIGLFGGSFNPPHEGHRLVSAIAARRLGLDQVWWMVTPGNPLKDHGHLRPLAERIAAVRAMGLRPWERLTAFEAAHAVRFSADSVAIARARNPRTTFVWVMGADSLTSFHRWQNWRMIAETVAIAVVDRPGSTLAPLYAPAARALWRGYVPETRAAILPDLAPPAWTFLHGPRRKVSSTSLRGLGRETS